MHVTLHVSSCHRRVNIKFVSETSTFIKSLYIDKWRSRLLRNTRLHKGTVPGPTKQNECEVGFPGDLGKVMFTYSEGLLLKRDLSCSKCYSRNHTTENCRKQREFKSSLLEQSVRVYLILKILFFMLILFLFGAKVNLRRNIISLNVYIPEAKPLPPRCLLIYLCKASQ